MRFSHIVIIAVALAVFVEPVIAGSKKTICHKGDTITIDKNALSAHLNHGDTEGACKVRPKPAYKAVAMIRCLNNDNGDLVVSGISISSNKQVNPLNGAPETACADAVAFMMNRGYKLQQVSTGLTDGETEYLFLGISNSQ